jgi:acyl carrier protein
MQTVNVLQMFQQAALEVNGKKLEALTHDTVISKLGLDSVAVMELVSYFEEKLSIRMPDEDLAKVQTLGDLAALVKRLVPAEIEVAA